MSSSKRLLKNIIWTVLASFVGPLIVFFANIYLARVMEPTGYGRINFAQSFANYFLFLVALGIPTLGTIEIAKDKANISKYVNQLMSLRVFLAIISFTLLLVVTFISPSLKNDRTLIIPFGLSLFTAAMLMEWVFQAVEMMEFIAIEQVLWRVLYFLLVFFLISKHSDIQRVPYFLLISNAAGAALLIYLYRNKIGKIQFDFDLSSWKYFLIKSVPISLSSLLIMVNQNYSTTLLGFTQTKDSVGLFTAPYKLVLFLWSIGGVLPSVFLATLSRFHEESSEKFNKLVNESTKITIMFIMPIGIVGTVLADKIILITLGRAYTESIVVFKILIWYGILSFLTWIWGYSLLAARDHKKYFKSIILGSVGNVLLCIILIPRVSTVGASFAMVFGELLICFSMYKRISQMLDLNFKKNLSIVILVSATIGWMLWYLLKINILLGFLPILLYFTLLLMFDVVKKDEIIDMINRVKPTR